jgi:hypothetical protein
MFFEGTNPRSSLESPKARGTNPRIVQKREKTNPRSPLESVGLGFEPNRIGNETNSSEVVASGKGNEVTSGG